MPSSPVRITALPSASLPPSDVDLLILEQEDGTKKLALESIKDYVGTAFLPLSGGLMTGDISFDERGAHIAVGSTDDEQPGGNGPGLSLYCAVGYELNWQAGYLGSRVGATFGDIKLMSGLTFTGFTGINDRDGAASIYPSERYLENSSGEPLLDWSGTHLVANGLKRDVRNNLGQLSGTIADLAVGNGSFQYCWISGNITFSAPIDGVEGDDMTLVIQWASSTYTVDFDDTIRRASDSGASFPKTLEAYRSYIIKLVYMGGCWCLVSFVGGFIENVD